MSRDFDHRYAGWFTFIGTDSLGFVHGCLYYLFFDINEINGNIVIYDEDGRACEYTSVHTFSDNWVLYEFDKAKPWDGYIEEDVDRSLSSTAYKSLTEFVNYYIEKCKEDLK